MKRYRLKRYNFQIKTKMNKENKNSDKQENGNDFIADVSDSCINITVKNAVDADSCNFCNRPSRKVNVVTGE